MHYCCLVITREFPSDQVLGKALEPYNEDLFYENKYDGRAYPEFMWDWWKVGGRYTGQFKVTHWMPLPEPPEEGGGEEC